MSQSIPFPANVELLSNTELSDLVEKHSDKLQLYVSQFQSTDTLVGNLEKDKNELLTLQNEFSKLQTDIDTTNNDLDNLRILNAQYIKKWQDVNQIVNEKFSENALKQQLQRKINELDTSSSTLESQIMNSRDAIEKNQLDTLMATYINSRVNYHINKEKLATWNQQGQLKK